jgi:hypothetical protein
VTVAVDLDEADLAEPSRLDDLVDRLDRGAGSSAAVCRPARPAVFGRPAATIAWPSTMSTLIGFWT